jgi:uncharacterized protein (TIGR02246 family)
MSLEEIAQRLETLEAIEAIKKLKARYCQCADEQDADGYAELFVEDGVFEGGTFGQAQGRTEIANFLRGIQRQSLPFAVHYVMNPHIEVAGEHATGRWYLLEPCTMVVESEQAVWGTARYEEEYVKVGGEWKFKTVKLIPVFWTPFDQGWVKKRFVQE